uniref:Protein yippee-like n=1 Tax=Rhizophora mucronata TaxID=61149 RepID=A0A2P2JFJ6_RHIMU
MPGWLSIKTSVEKSISPTILPLSRTNFPSLTFWLFSCAASYFQPTICPQQQQNISATMCNPESIILSSKAPTVIFTLQQKKELFDVTDV